MLASNQGPDSELGRIRRRNESRRSRRGRLSVEALERRELPALTFSFADAIAATGGGAVDVEANSVTTDGSGNVYITGSLEGTADFVSSTGAPTVASSGSRDVFLAKYSSTGALLWAKDLPGSGSTTVAQGGAIAVDSSGDVIITGTFTGTVNFNPNGGSTTLSAPGENDVFVAKYDPNGNLLWADNVGGTSGAIDEGYAVAVDAAGNIAIGGSYQNSATFGSTTLTAGGNFESFVAKLSPSGAWLWADSTAGSDTTAVTQTAGVAFDASDDVVATGFFAGTVNFNPAGTSIVPPYGGSRDIFVEKFTPTGGVSWAVGIGSPDIDQGNAITTDSAGNIYVTGVFSDTVNFNPNLSGTADNLTAGGFEDGFLWKLSPTGQTDWADDLAGANYNAVQGTGVGVNSGGQVFVAGYFNGTATLGPSNVLTSVGSYDAFVAEYTSSGSVQAAQSAGGANFDADYGIGVNNNGQIALAGRYTGPATFGSFTLPQESSNSVFVTELTAPTTLPAGPVAPSAPVLQAASDSGLSSSDGITNVTSPTFNASGITASNYVVSLLRNGVVVATRTGAGAITDPGPVPNGVYSYTLEQTDTNGNISTPSASTTITISTTTPATPAAPVLYAADDSGAPGGDITNVTQPRLIGTIDPSTLAQLLNSSGTVIASAMASSTGAYTLQPPSPLSSGTYTYSVREESVAGNFSAASAYAYAHHHHLAAHRARARRACWRRTIRAPSATGSPTTTIRRSSARRRRPG